MKAAFTSNTTPKGSLDSLTHLRARSIRRGIGAEARTGAEPVLVSFTPWAEPRSAQLRRGQNRSVPTSKYSKTSSRGDLIEPTTNVEVFVGVDSVEVVTLPLDRLAWVRLGIGLDHHSLHHWHSDAASRKSH